MGLEEINVGFIEGSFEWEQECQRLIRALEMHGAISVFGHQVDDALRWKVIELMNHVYRASSDVQVKWVRKDQYYQVGLTPPGVEKHRFHEGWNDLAPQHRPRTNQEGTDEYKYRWFEPFGPEGALPYTPVDPGLAGFRQALLAWGEALGYAVVKNRLARMIAGGYGLPLEHFEDMLKRGVHLVAPTGADLTRLLTKLEEGEQEFISLAGFHNDLNWGTIHGRASFPGLWIWTTSGERRLARIKEGHLLFQVGQQLAAQTAYRMKAGFHEVVITRELGKEIAERAAGDTFAWRIGSTVFVTADLEASLMPHDSLFEGLDRDRLLATCPHLSMTVAQQMRSELEKIAFA